MLFETESPGDTIAAPICHTNDREDALSRNPVDSHSDQADAEPTAVLLEDWRDTVIKPAAGCAGAELAATTAARRGQYRYCTSRFCSLARMYQLDCFDRCRAVV
jgi:hypothetical protein